MNYCDFPEFYEFSEFCKLGNFCNLVNFAIIMDLITFAILVIYDSLRCNVYFWRENSNMSVECARARIPNACVVLRHNKNLCENNKVKKSEPEFAK